MAQGGVQFDIEVQTASPAHEQIARHIRRMIEKGHLAGGCRLPANPEQARQIGVSPTAVHRALYRLRADGLVDRKPGRGTFVRAKTDQATIGLLFGPRLSDESAHSYRAMHRALDEKLLDRHWVGRPYSGFRSLDRTPEFEAQAFAQLAKDCRQYRFSGLIAVHVLPDDLDARPDLKGLPRAVYHAAERRGDIHINRVVFLRHCVEWFVQQGRKRIFQLSVRPQNTPRFMAVGDQAFQAALHAAGLPRLQEAPFVPADYGYREQEIHGACMELFRQWKRLSAKSRPDALIVDDDIAMRAVALALIQSGISVPDELLVITEATDQTRLHYGIPVVRYEFSTKAVAGVLVDLLWRRLAGDPLPPLPLDVEGVIREAAGRFGE